MNYETKWLFAFSCLSEYTRLYPTHLNILLSPCFFPCTTFSRVWSKHSCVIFSGPWSQSRNSKWPLLKEFTSNLTSMTFLPRPYVLLIARVVYFPPSSWSRGPSYGSPHNPHFPVNFLIVWNWNIRELCKHRFCYPNAFCYLVTKCVKWVTKVRAFCNLNLETKCWDSVDKTFTAFVTLWLAFIYVHTDPTRPFNHFFKWAQWPRAWLETGGRGFEPHRRYCVVSLSKAHLSLLSTG